MSQIVVLAAIGTVAYLGYRAVKSTFEAGMALKPAPVPVRAVRLERGIDGVYRPVTRTPSHRI